MIGAARSSLQSLFRQVAGQNRVLLMTDAKGVCVDSFGDDLFVDDLRTAGLYLGSNCSESLAGTCGVGACVVTQEPVTVHQDDHFGNAHTTLSRTAAPIFDSLGGLAAVLDISLLRPIVTTCADPAALALPRPLFHRLAGATLRLPALRRRRDLGWPHDRILHRRAPEDIRLSPDARRSSAARGPGNLRELAGARRGHRAL